MTQQSNNNEAYLLDLSQNLLQGFLDVLCDGIEKGESEDRITCILDAFLKQASLLADIQKQCNCPEETALRFLKDDTNDQLGEFKQLVFNNIACQPPHSAAKLVRSWAEEKFFPKSDTEKSCCEKVG